MHSAQPEAIHNTLSPLWDKALDKWTRCQWRKKVGLSLDLKGLLAADFIDLTTQAAIGFQEQSHLLHDTATKSVAALQEKPTYELIQRLFRYAEIIYHSRSCIDYLKDVERRAAECQEAGTDSLNAIKEGDFQKAFKLANEMLLLEDIRPGKKVWKPLAIQILTYCKALFNGWEPLFIVEDPTTLLGGLWEKGATELVLETAERWTLETPEQKNPTWLYANGVLTYLGSKCTRPYVKI